MFGMKYISLIEGVELPDPKADKPYQFDFDSVKQVQKASEILGL